MLLMSILHLEGVIKNPQDWAQNRSSHPAIQPSIVFHFSNSGLWWWFLHADRPWPDGGFKPMIFLLWGDSANHHTPMLPTEASIFFSLSNSQSWTGCQSVAELTHRDGKPFTLTFTLMADLESWVNIPCLSLDCGRKLGVPERASAGTGQHANCTQKRPRWQC